MNIEQKKLELLESEIRLKEQELETRQHESKLASWFSPLVLSIIVASIAAASNAWIAYHNANADRAIQIRAAENDRILQMLAVDKEQAVENMEFLLQTSLISDNDLRSNLQNYLNDRQPGEGVSLVSITDTVILETSVVSIVEIFRSDQALLRLSGRIFQSGTTSVQSNFDTAILPELIDWILKQDSNSNGVQISVVGHTDNIPLTGQGRIKTLDELSFARASTISSILEGALPERFKIKTEGRGARDPIADNSTSEGRAENRRIEIFIVPVN